MSERRRQILLEDNIGIFNPSTDLPPNCVFYIDPALSLGVNYITNYASQFGRIIGLGTNANLIRNSVSIVNGPNGKILSFNGVGDFCSITNNSNIDITTATPEKPLSVFCITNIDSANTQNCRMISKNADNLTATVQYELFYDNTTSTFQSILEGAAGSVSGKVVKGKYYFHGFVWDGSNVQHYVNLTVSGSPVAISGPLTSRASVFVGKRNTTAYLQGLLGVLFICQAPFKDIYNWAKKVKILERYGIPF